MPQRKVVVKEGAEMEQVRKCDPELPAAAGREDEKQKGRDNLKGRKGNGKGKKGKGKGKKGSEEKEWMPVTKLGRLVKEKKIESIEDIYLHSLPIKEFQIIDNFFAPGTLKDEVMKIHPVQKMSAAGQTNRFVCYVLVGDCNGHIGLGAKCAKEVATAIRGGIIAAKLSLIPIRRGYWGGRLGGIADCFTCSCGHTRTKGNFMKAAFEALRNTYGYLTPDLWKPTYYMKTPFQEFTDFLAQSKPTASAY